MDGGIQIEKIHQSVPFPQESSQEDKDGSVESIKTPEKVPTEEETASLLEQSKKNIETREAELAQASRLAERIKKGEVGMEKITSVEKLIEFIHEKGSVFFNSLESVSTGIPPTWGRNESIGWEEIFVTPDGMVRKEDSNPKNKNAVFNGSSMCYFAAYALHEGLQNKLDNFSLEVVQLYSDFGPENWDKPGYEQKEWDHLIVKVTDEKTGKVIYLDPTYRQVDSRTDGTIQIMDESELALRYRDREKRDPKVVTPLKDENLKIMNSWGLTKERYEKLLDALGK